MLPPHQRHGRVLLTARDVVLDLGAGRQVGPLDCSITLGQRVSIQTAYAEQWGAMTSLFTGERFPILGRLEEIDPVKAQTDANILANLDLNRSIGEFLNSPDAPEFVWLDQRRRVIWVLLDTLGITPDMTRMPLKLGPGNLIEKFCALRFLVSKADLLLGRDIFASRDPAIQRALARRWPDFTAAVIAHVPPGKSLPGACDVAWRVDEAGALQMEDVQSSEEPL